MDLREIIDVIILISNNIFILLSIVFLYTLTNYELNRNKRIKQVLSGIVIGFIALFLMSNPFEFQAGIVFDARSILLPISGVFFGPITTIIAALMSIAFRAYLGGIGMGVGIATIVISASIGIIWRYVFKKYTLKNRYLEYYLLGLIVNLPVLLLMFFLPDNINIFRYVFPIYILLYPVVTMLIGSVIVQQQDRIATNKLQKAQKTLLQSSIDASHNIEIYAVDKAYNYLTFNLFHQSQIKKFFSIEIQLDMYMLSIYSDEVQQLRIKESIDKALAGAHFHTVVEVDLNGSKIFEEHFTPIKRGKDIIGVTIFIKDITKEKIHEASILKLSYYDSLTGLPNRRRFQENIVEMSKIEFNPVTIITCDINGLKLFNDALGHKAGDEVLVEVANVLTKHLTKHSTVSRIGGDEFVFILPNTDEKTASTMIEKLDQVFENKLFKGVKLSISYGMATKHENDHMDDIIKFSEEQMYKNKLFEKTSHRSEFIKSILNTLREKNPREENHSKRVAMICTEIGKRLDMKKHELNLLEAIASLHDIGKIAIDEAILNKPGKLTETEWNAIKKHPEIGYRIISTAPEYAEIAEDILSHHEHYNGKGYPRGLKGEDIPIRARIVAIADAYDAMISKRTYKEPMSHADALAEIIRCKGTQFDPNFVDIFIDLNDTGILNLGQKG